MGIWLVHNNYHDKIYFYELNQICTNLRAVYNIIIVQVYFCINYSTDSKSYVHDYKL